MILKSKRCLVEIMFYCHLNRPETALKSIYISADDKEVHTIDKSTMEICETFLHV